MPKQRVMILPIYSGLVMICALIKGSSIRSDSCRIGHFSRIIYNDLFSFCGIGNKTYVGNRGNYCLIKLSFQSFLDNFHVQHSQESRNGNQNPRPVMFPVQKSVKHHSTAVYPCNHAALQNHLYLPGKIPANTIGFTSSKPLIISWIWITC